LSALKSVTGASAIAWGAAVLPVHPATVATNPIAP
jgi:hypothetical protein